ALAREHAGGVGRHRRDHRDAATPDLAREHTAGVAVPAGPERGTADQDVGRQLVDPAKQYGEGVGFVLPEVIVAASDRDVGSQAGRDEAPARPGGSVEAERSRAGSLLATEPREELVEVVDDGHDATAVRSSSPVSPVAPRYAQSGTRRP